ncbi:MAG: GDP-L-fucose synthase [Gammaproteobacteria bacterium]|nr:GDP-L-fucose synthase [Gammaproteobacteria bacterium]
MSEPAGAPREARIFVAGHRGMVGAAIVRRLQAAGCGNLLLCTRAELDLTRQDAVERFFRTERPEQVYLAAARVGGILANSTRPAEFIAENLAIALHVIQAAHASGVQRLLFLGSSCIYPRLAPQPMTEAALLTGALEPTNEPYAIAKIAGIKLCESFNRQYGTDFRSVMPTNLYGPGDNFDLKTSHVLPALIRKFHEAKAAGAPEVEVWGSGTPRREFLHVDDLADACVFVMNLPKARLDAVTTPTCSHLNVGTGSDVTIRELAGMVADAVGYTGRIAFNAQYPDGTPRKLLDVSVLQGLGWQPAIALREGLIATYDWYTQNR